MLNGWFYDLSAPGWGVCFITGLDGRVGGAVFLHSADGMHRWFTLSERSRDGNVVYFDAWLATCPPGYPVASPVVNKKVGEAAMNVITQEFSLTVQELTTAYVHGSPMPEGDVMRTISAALSRLL